MNWDNIREFLDINWPIIRVIGVFITVGSLIVGVIAAWLSYQRTNELLSTPNLEVLSFYFFSLPDGFGDIEEELVNEFYDLLFEKHIENSDASYQDLLSQMPQLSRPTDPYSVVVQTKIENVGNLQATGFVFEIHWGKKISKIWVDSLSDEKIIDGGNGYNFVTIEIPKIRISEQVIINVTFEPSENLYSEIILTTDVITSPSNTRSIGPLFIYQREENDQSINISLMIGSDEIPLHSVKVDSEYDIGPQFGPQ